MSHPWGELPQHPDWIRLIRDLENRVDKAQQDVLSAAEREDLPTVRSRSGACNAMRMLLREVIGARSAEEA